MLTTEKNIASRAPYTLAINEIIIQRLRSPVREAFSYGIYAQKNPDESFESFKSFDSFEP